MLSVGLLIGSASGAIAAADTDTSGVPNQTQGPDGTGQGVAPSGGQTGSDGDERSAGGDTTQPAGDSGEQPASGTTPQDNDPVNPNIDDDVTSESGGSGSGSGSGSGPSILDTGSAASDPNPPASDPSPPTAEPSPPASDPSPPASDPGPVGSNSPPPPPAPSIAPPFAVAFVNPPMPPPPPLPPFWNAVQQSTMAMGTFANVVGTVPATLSALPTSSTPMLDVIAAVQQMLTSGANVLIPFTQLHGDIYSMFGIPITVSAIGQAASVGHLLPALDLTMPGGPTASWPQVSTATTIWGLPTAVQSAPLVKLGGTATTGLTQGLSLTGAPETTPDAATPASPLSIFEHAVTAVLVPASLTALAALALPGVAALLVVCAAGMRIGYRQAKAALAVRSSGIARFAGPGPLGVVRSGSLISLHDRGQSARRRVLRSTRPSVARAEGLLEQVA